MHCGQAMRAAARSRWQWNASDIGPSLARLKHYAAVLESRGVLQVAGQDALSFLQGLLTKDTKHLAVDQAKPILAAMLNPQGRCMYDLILHRAAGTDIFLDTRAADRGQLLANLMRFKLRKAVSIADVSESYCVAAHFQPAPCRGQDTASVNTDEASTSGRIHTALCDLPWDPRLAALGRRGVVLRTDATAAMAAHAAASSEGANGSEEAYARLRYSLGVAEGDEIPKGTAMPLEYNFDLLNGVSFDKGCYMGQELVARTHFQGLVRKRVVPIRLRDASDQLAPDMDIVVADAPKPVGKLRAVSGTSGLAILRLEHVAAATEGRLAMRVKGTAVEVVPVVPHWWPWQTMLESIETR